jgi:hypothetical protein
MSRRASTTLLLCVLALGLPAFGAATDTDTTREVSRVTAYLDAPDLDTDVDSVAPLVVAVLAGATLAWALGPWTVAPRSPVAARVPVTRRRAPARSPPPC